MNITEKAAYLKGLIDGQELDAGAKETKLFNAIIDIIGDLALTVSDLDDEVAIMAEQLDAVDEDLEELEDFVFEFCDCDCDCDDDCDCFDFDDDDEIFEVECPACHETVFFDESIFEDADEARCPACGAVFDDIVIDDED